MKLNKDFMELIRPQQRNDLVRVGRNHDGGYVISYEGLKLSPVLVSIGYGDDSSFESQYLSTNPQNTAVLFDDKASFMNYGTSLVIEFVKRLMGDEDSHPRKSFIIFKSYIQMIRVKRLHYKRRTLVVERRKRNQIDLVSLSRNIKFESAMLKVDIEGAEYACLQNISVMKSLNQVIIEFHEIDRNLEKFKKIVKDLQSQFSIINLHVNNFGYITEGIPSTIELTFLNKKLIREGNLPVERIPSDIDQRNSLRFPEVTFHYSDPEM